MAPDVLSGPCRLESGLIFELVDARDRQKDVAVSCRYIEVSRNGAERLRRPSHIRGLVVSISDSEWVTRSRRALGLPACTRRTNLNRQRRLCFGTVDTGMDLDTGEVFLGKLGNVNIPKKVGLVFVLFVDNAELLPDDSSGSRG